MSYNGYEYRCVVKSGSGIPGTKNSGTAKLSVATNEPLGISSTSGMTLAPGYASVMSDEFVFNGTFDINGNPNWYDSYVKYAKDNGIINKDYDWNAQVTRAGYMEIFANTILLGWNGTTKKKRT